jgi:hypothetical protein
VAVTVNENLDFAFLDDEHASTLIPLPEQNIAIAVLFPQSGHADAVTCLIIGLKLCQT